MKLSKLKSNPNNPRLIKDDKFKKLVKSIEDFPEMMEKRPIVCVTDIDGKIFPLGGNMRLKALQEIGFKEIPDSWVVLADEWTEEKRKEFVIKDNVGFGEWDWDDLGNNWDAEQLTEWGLDIPNFEPEVLEAEEDDFAVPDGGIETDIVLGDLFEIGEHRLLCGDSTDSDQVTKLMNGQKADMVFTDPPYGMFLETNLSNNINWSKDGWKGKSKNYTNIIGDHDDFSEELINTIFSHFSDTKELFIWGADYFAELIPNKNEGSWFVWNKTRNNEENEQIKSNGSQFELCWSKNKHKRIVINVLWKGLMGTESQDIRLRVHPTQKPIQICSFFIKEYSKENNNIIDLYIGSGSTMVAAHQLKRKCYGMELDPKYCQVIVDRMIKLDPTLEVKRNGQPYNKTAI
jgi:DNA modification methylase